MRVAFSMPCLRDRWSPLAFGFLGDGNTCLFRGSACTSQGRRRLFFERFCVARKQALADTDTGIAIGMSLHLALWAEAEGRTGGVAFSGLALIIANDEGMATMAFSARILWVDPAGDDPLVPRLI